MEIKRISKYSKICVLGQHIPDGSKCIQAVSNEDGRFGFIEYIEADNIADYIAEQSGMSPTTNSAPIEPVKSESQKELETALNTVLTNDPRGKYSGCMLKEPFDNGDRDWIEWCLSHMQNKFIRNRIELIYKANYGNI